MFLYYVAIDSNCLYTLRYISKGTKYIEMVKENYALKGAGSSMEFEAKLISDKIQMIDQGVIDPSGKVTKDDLQAIQQWYSKQKPYAAFLNPLFKNIDHSPKYTKTLLKALNKA